MIYEQTPPSGDLELQMFATNMSNILTAGPLPFGVTVAQATELSDRLAVYSTNLALSKAPETRTEITIEAKDDSKVLLLAYCRSLAQFIGKNPAVSKEQRMQLGLHIPRTPARQDPPTNVPTVELHVNGPTSIGMRAHSGDALVRRMPAGVLGMTVWTFLGESAPLDVKQWQCQGPVTRPTAEFDFGMSAANPTRAWVAVCWFNRRGAGPMSLPMSVRLAGLELSEQLEQQAPQGMHLAGEDELAQAA